MVTAATIPLMAISAFGDLGRIDYPEGFLNDRAVQASVRAGLPGLVPACGALLGQWRRMHITLKATASLHN
jgi:hypothetical protein